MKYTRCSFAKQIGSASAAGIILPDLNASFGNPLTAEVVNPYNRVPVSLIIDDSNCLVNMAHFGIPQFA